ncbi:sn-glycerol-3-phosphate import ATP-binding protein UgpC [Gemmatimonadetes bacterium T265]|nr:sn-glycerol-3-phosphate import ATP-binding protein UgpC [Gemmatimonadetes bacterium T265]
MTHGVLGGAAVGGPADNGASVGRASGNGAPVKLDALRKVYDGGQVAVHGVDLDVAAGEFVVLVGPSGCGKSTTLRMIAGLEPVSGGRVMIGGRDVTGEPPAHRDIAMVFQTYALYPQMTVRENMGFALRLRKRPAADVDARVRAVADTLDLTPLLDRLPKQLSGGQRQRVAIGRAIVREPRVFLFDEPLSNLDAKLRGQMRREIAALHRRLGATTIYVTHDQVEAMTLGDRIVVMRAGQVEQIDAPAALYARPRTAFVAAFVGSPPMNLFRGQVDPAAGTFVVAGAEALAVELPPALLAAAQAHLPSGREALLGVRPEHVAVAAATPDPARPTLAMRVELAEPLGHELLAHSRRGAAELTARLAPDAPLPPAGGVAQFVLDPGALHLFDAEGGMVIGRSSP